MDFKNLSENKIFLLEIFAKNFNMNKNHIDKYRLIIV